MMHIQINSVVGGWHNVDEDMARRFVSRHIDMMSGIPEEERVEFIEKNLIRGVTVKELMGGRS